MKAPRKRAPRQGPSGSRLFFSARNCCRRDRRRRCCRARLIERLHANLRLPVTLVTANAGSGKTTLVADFLRKQERPFVWYQLDRTDADPSAFLGYLTYGIQQRVEGFGETIFAFLQQAHEL